MAMRDNNSAEICSIKSHAIKLPRKLEAAAGVDKQWRAAWRGYDHASHRPIWMERSTCAQKRNFHRTPSFTLFACG
jgi:hypothetical protein